MTDTTEKLKDVLLSDPEFRHAFIDYYFSDDNDSENKAILERKAHEAYESIKANTPLSDKEQEAIEFCKENDLNDADVIQKIYDIDIDTLIKGGIELKHKTYYIPIIKTVRTYIPVKALSLDDATQTFKICTSEGDFEVIKNICASHDQFENDPDIPRVTFAQEITTKRPRMVHNSFEFVSNYCHTQEPDTDTN